MRFFEKIFTIAAVCIAVGFPATSVYLHRNDAPSENPWRAEHAQKEQAQTQALTQKNCAAARAKLDQLYRDGVAHPTEKVDVRAACEPDEVARESYQKWLIVGLVLVAAVFLLPSFLFGLGPR